MVKCGEALLATDIGRTTNTYWMNVSVDSLIDAHLHLHRRK